MILDAQSVKGKKTLAPKLQGKYPEKKKEL